MISVIVQKAWSHYGAGMASAVFRLLALLALTFMPLGMSGAPALAMPVDHAMPTAGHCDEQPARHQAPAPSKMDCTTMCTALPATVAPTPAPGLKPVAPRNIVISSPISGIEPEIATPPPKRG